MFEHKNFSLTKGRHSSPDDGLCLMEAVAFLTGDPHSDVPQCACPVLANFARVINDALDDPTRDEFLIPLIPMLVGTSNAQRTRQSGTVEEQLRGEAFARWAINEIAPAVLAGTQAAQCTSILRSTALLPAAEELLWAAHDTLVEADATALAIEALRYVTDAARNARCSIPEKAARYAACAAASLAKLKWNQAFTAAMERKSHPRRVAQESATVRRAIWAHSVQFFWSQIAAAQPTGSTPVPSPVKRGPVWRPARG